MTPKPSNVWTPERIETLLGLRAGEGASPMPKAASGRKVIALQPEARS